MTTEPTPNYPEVPPQEPAVPGGVPAAVPPSMPSLAAPETAGIPVFTALDPRILKLWRVSHLIGTLVLLGLAAMGVVFAGTAFPQAWVWFWAGWFALAGLRAFLWFWYLPRAYQCWQYRLDGRVLETRRGVWWQVTQLLPLTRLQHVDLHRGPFERYYGLASLILHTAGTQHATLEIPGLDAEEAGRLRDQLVVKGGDDGV